MTPVHPAREAERNSKIYKNVIDLLKNHWIIQIVATIYSLYLSTLSLTENCVKINTVARLFTCKHSGRNQKLGMAENSRSCFLAECYSVSTEPHQDRVRTLYSTATENLLIRYNYYLKKILYHGFLVNILPISHRQTLMQSDRWFE